ncbi:hypothetical protein Y032_0114g450 [Ancylostoma ceylanicum]|uniref:Abnormal cell migration protein 18-like fibronectin type I domain-containing protein n=1 Tax=Ancylostoma ceylanicum TaxID=53326 RepID=A0A016TCG4_9BILA|nr:hypothetical protein Y032_0114g450 [Ancylostoma ceylanicum]
MVTYWSFQLLQSEVEPDRKATMVAPSVVRSEHKGVKDQPAITCVSKGKVYHPEETWISENKFTKKCTPDGSVIILNCLMDDKTTINVNTELKLGKNTYKCYRNKAEGRVYFEVISE